MIDIHTHILPDIDDGPLMMQDSILMARKAAESGVDTLIATPHCNVEGLFDNYYNDDLLRLFCEFKKEIEKEKIPLKVLFGMEVFGTEEVPGLIRSGKIIPLHHSRYLLLEFSFEEDIPLMDFVINEVTNQGLCPIIAHPERYPYIQRNPEYVSDWISRGCFLQVNKGSILGGFGKRVRDAALHLLSTNMVSLIASDAHGPCERTTDMSGIYHLISSCYSEQYADILLEQNPRRVIEDRFLIKLNPV